MVQFRPGASSETDNWEKEQAIKKEAEKTPATRTIEYLDDMLGSRAEGYSETYLIKPDGSFDLIRSDGTNRYLMQVDTPNEFYQLAQEIEKINPEYHFNFEVDPEGKWLKYTVKKD